MNIKGFLSPPVYSSYERTQKSVFLHVTLICMAMALLIFGFLNLSWDANTLGVTFLIFSGVSIVGFSLNKSLHYYPAAMLLTATALITIFYNLIDGAALHDPGIAALPILLIITSFIFDRSIIPFFTLVSIMGVAGILFFWNLDLLELNQAPTPNRVIILAILLVVTGVITWVISSSYQKVVDEFSRSEKQYQSLFEKVPVGLFRTTPKGKILDANQAILDMLGFDSRDDLLVTNLNELFKDPQDRQQLFAGIAQDEVIQANLIQLKRKDGKTIWVEENTSVGYDTDDEIIFEGALVDVTKRKQAEESLRASEKRLRAAATCTSDLIWETDHESGGLEWFGDIDDALDYEPKEFPRTINGWLESIHPDDLNHVNQALERSTASGEDYFAEYRIQKKGGSFVYWEDRGTTTKTRDGKLIQSVGAITDITERKIAENTLRESAERHRVFVEDSPAMIWHYEIQPPLPLDLPVEGQIDWMLNKSVLVETNEAYARKVGLSSGDQLIGISLLKSWGGDTDLGKKNFQEFIDHGYKFKTYETRETNYFGESVWSIINASSVIEDHQLIRIWGTTIDITERKLTEEAIRQSEEKFHKVFMASPYSITISRISDGTIVDVNEGFERNTGYSLEEVKGCTMNEIGLIKDPNLSNKILEVFNKQGQLRDNEIELVHKDGHKMISIFSSETIELNGEPHMVSIGMDITKLRESEHALQESDIRNRIILQSLPMVFYRALPYGKFGGTWVSEQVDEIVGFSPEEMVDPDFWSSRLHPDDRAEALLAFDRLPETDSLEIEYRWKRADGEFIWIQDNAVLIKDDLGLAHEIIGTWTDITDRRKAEKAVLDYTNRLEILRDIDEGILAAQSSSEISNIAAAGLRKLIPCQRISIVLFDTKTHMVEFIAVNSDFETNNYVGNRVSLEDYQDRLIILKSGQIVIDPEVHPDGLINFIRVPMIAQEVLIGVLNIGTVKLGTFTEEHEKIALQVATQLAIAILQAQLRDQIQNHSKELEQRVNNRTRELAALYEVSAVATSSTNLENTIATVTQLVIESVDGDFGGIHLLDDDKAKLVLAYQLDAPEKIIDQRKVVPIGNGLVGKVLEQGEPIYVPDVTQDPGLIIQVEEPYSWLGVPMRASGQDIGVFSILGKPGKPELTNEEIALLTSMIDQAAAVMESARLREHSEHAAALEERQRLARELHDAVSQTLFSASVIAQTLDRLWERDPELVRQNLVELQKLIQGALAEMRTLLLELRPAALEHTSMVELLRQLADGFSGRTQTDIEILITGQNPLPIEIRATFFRMVQEALNNIIKHARAQEVRLEYDSQDDLVRFGIKDNGRGFNLSDQLSGHHGIAIMCERADSIAAELAINSKPGEGTQIEIVWNNTGRKE